MREIQCRRAILTGYDRPVTCGDGGEKRLELKLQRLLFAASQLLNDDGRPHTGARLATADHALPRLEVDRQIVVPLKQPEAPHLVRGDTACREISHASAGELNPCVGDIDGR